MKQNRREFLLDGAGAVGCLGLAGLPWLASGRGLPVVLAASEDDVRFVREAMYYDKLPGKRVECTLCPRKCRVADVERGWCGVRENRGGKYYTLVFSRVCSAHVDPIEKKPLFHYLPGTRAFSIATAGCNIECKFCQNWEISQFRPEQVSAQYAPPEAVVRTARRQRCPTIAYTYSEPVIFYEYAYEISRVAREMGVGSVMITNGYIQKEPLVEICQQLNAIKIDFKGFTDRFYRDVCRGELKPVLETLETLATLKIWREIVVLIIPTLNDSEAEIRGMSEWIHRNLGDDVPVHFTRFHPMYKIKNLPDTPVRTLERCRQIALAAGLHYVYVGNVPGHEGENTYCPRCQRVVIRRIGYSIVENNLQDACCRFCRQPIAGVWKT